MSIYTFSGKDLEDLAHAVLSNDRFKLPFQEEWTDRKGVWLVKDAGIYLINAHAGNVELVMCDEFDALMAGSERDHDKIQAMLDGDDYAKFLDLDKAAWGVVAKGFFYLRVTMNADNFTVLLLPTAKILAATKEELAAAAMGTSAVHSGHDQDA